MAESLTINTQNILKAINTIKAQKKTIMGQQSGVKRVGVETGKYAYAFYKTCLKAGFLANTGIPVDVLYLSKKSTKDTLNLGALIVKNFVSAALKLK